jgi:hypothetical protein
MIYEEARTMGCIQRPGQFEDSVVLEVTHAVRPIPSGLGDSISLRLPSGYRISRALCKMRVGAYITGYASQSRSEGTQAFCLNRTRAKIVGDQGRGKIGRHSKRVGGL